MVGETLGSYRIVSEIGTGGMGVVYLAEHTLLGKKCAVKLLRSDVAAEQVERFFTEAKAAATLQHPGLVDVFDFGHHTDGSAYIVMEFLPGESLAERLERDPRLPVPIACAITRQVANALHVAHELGIVHRDLKPGNIFLVPDPDSPSGVRTKVLDFGIAKLVREREPRSVKTHSGAVIGTPRYMSPEQCKNARNVDGRSDIYSLGCILYEMLLGVAPFDYDSWGELVGAHLHEEPPKPTELDPALPEDVATLLVKMLEKKPADRFQSMQDLAQSLEVLLRDHGVTPGGSVRMTPASGVKPIARDKRASDPTLPASDEKNKTPSGVRRISEAEQEAKKRAESAPTLAPPGQRKLPWLAISGAVLGIGGVVVALVVILGKNKPTEPSETYVVVDKRDSEGAEPGSADPVEVGAIDAGVATAKPVEPTNDAGAKKPESQAEQLTRAFGRQRAKVASCFKDQAPPNEEISVRISIDTSGKVVGAEVLPASVASTPLGGCIQGAAKGATFGAQPKAITFRVPIHARGG